MMAVKQFHLQQQKQQNYMYKYFTHISHNIRYLHVLFSSVHISSRIIEWIFWFHVQSHRNLLLDHG